MPTVFVTGANGFIAQHLTVQLIAKGYEVVGSVRTKEKGEILANKIKSKSFKYVVICDLSVENALDDVLKSHPEIVGFFHTAAPSLVDAKNFETEVISPTIKSTENALRSIKKFAPQVKRFIYTSSYAAITSAEHTIDTVITEKTWNQVTRNSGTNPKLAYHVSKTFAEKACWDFVKTESPNFTVNTVAPNMVIGPEAFSSETNFSAMVSPLLKLQPGEPLSPLIRGFIDVRDVARTHIFALETDITNFRFLCHEDFFTSQLLLDLIHKNFPKLSDLTGGNPGAGSDFSHKSLIDNSATRQLVGPFIDLESSLVDTVKQLLEL